tara:strand:- start:286 stop:609 length:324 start_codon:yes stop_codon:yes gene_type:complete
MGNPLSREQIGDFASVIEFCNDDMHEYVQFAYMLNDDLPEKVAQDEERSAVAFVERIVEVIEKLEEKELVTHLHLAYLMQEIHSRGVANLVQSLNSAKDTRFRLDNV